MEKQIIEKDYYQRKHANKEFMKNIHVQKQYRSKKTGTTVYPTVV